MSVSSSVVLPAQPPIGLTTLLPLGGDGTFSPHSCYVARIQVVGDVSGGTATLEITGDQRFTNLVAWVNIRTLVAAAATDFQIRIQPTSGEEGVQVVGTMPQVPTTLVAANASFLWYPPPLYHPGTGFIDCKQVNVGTGETYQMVVQIYCFDIDIRRLTPLPFLQQNVPGVSAPAAI